MRTVIREGAPQRALRNRTRDAGEAQDFCDFGEGGGMCNQAHILQKVTAGLKKVGRVLWISYARFSVRVC